MSTRDNWLFQYYMAHARLWRGHPNEAYWLERAISIASR